jgi:hypothetical protein
MKTATAPAAVQGLGPIVVMEKLSHLLLASEAPKELGLQVRKGDDHLGMEELALSRRWSSSSTRASCTSPAETAG